MHIPAAMVLRESNRDIFSHEALTAQHIAPFAQRNETRENHRRITEFARTLRGLYTHALIATEDPAGYRLARDARIAQRIGFHTGLGKPFKNFWIRRMCTKTIYRSPVVDSSGLHECQILFKLGRSLVANAGPVTDVRELRPLVLDDPTARDERIVMQVTSKWQRLGARSEDVVDLAKRLHGMHGARYLAATAEREYAQRVAAAAGVTVEYFDMVREWKQAIGASRAIVAPDGGAIHVAGMTGVPTVAAFAAGPKFFDQTMRWRPWAAPHRVLAIEGAWPLVASDALDELLERSTPPAG